MTAEMNARDRNILNALIHNYIKTAYPVGSRTLTKAFDIGLSPASVRNIMADLEDMGYLQQPHPSAGRIPTEKGYRFYVDELLGGTPAVWENDFSIGPYSFARTENMKDLLQEVSQLLSTYSHCTGIVLAPRFNLMTFQHLQFIRIRRQTVLTVFVSAEGLVQNKVIQTEDDFTQEDLDRFSSFLNERFRGKTLQEIRTRLLDLMRQDKELYHHLFQTAADLATKALKENQASDLFVEGTTNIMDQPEFSDIEKMKSLFHAFEEKYIIMKFLDSCFDQEGVKVFVGSETTHLGTNDCSLVITNYKIGDQVLGVLGVIGPMRMEYSKVIPLVEYTAKRLSEVLEDDAA